MTTLELISEENKTFKSLGCYKDQDNTYDESDLFKKDTIVKLIEGKFPLTDYKDLYKHSKRFHKFDNTTVKLNGFCISCVENKVRKCGTPKIVVSKCE